MRRSHHGTIAFAFSLALIGAAPLALAAQDCTALAKFSMPGQRIVIRKAEDVAATPPGSATSVPSHCRVDGIIDERSGRNGKPYGIGFAVA